MYGGETDGPRGGSVAVDVASGGSPWSNPTAVLLNDNVFAVISVPVGGAPSSAPVGSSMGSGTAWTNPNNLQASGSSYATVNLTIPSTPPPPVPTYPNITSVSPISGYVGTLVTITGANFGTSQGTSFVRFNAVVASVSSWSATSISVYVPSAASIGANTITVTVAGNTGTGASYTVIQSTGGSGGSGGGGGSRRSLE